MGSGAPRELQQSGPTRQLPEEFAAKLTVACDKLDAINPEFKQARDDERLQQLIKSWGELSGKIVEHLRDVGNVLHKSHQLTLDMSSDGGGLTATPWIEEMGRVFPRLEFKVQEDGEIHVVSGGDRIGEGRPEDISYEWVEGLVVKWVLHAVEKMR